MQITPDEIIYWEYGLIIINATIVFTWVLMALMVGGSFLITRRIKKTIKPSRWQMMLETIVEVIRQQITEISNQPSATFLPFIGTLFLFIVVSNILMVVPGFQPPTGSLSTTAALALCVFFAVPIFGISQQGLGSYLKQYLRPTPLMLPFNIIGEVSRTMALAVRLFGNVMSGTLIVAILISLIPLVFPIVMQVLGLLTGVIQAYIFAILALVYISSGMREKQENNNQERG